MNSRRDFLRMLTMSAAASSLPLSIERALAIPPYRASGTIRDVEHVVILMQENRSFDHYFGSLRGVRGFDDPRPAPLREGKPIWYQPTASVRTKRYKNRGLRPDATHVLPFYLNPKVTTEYQAGTNHGWSSGHLAWDNGHYDAWVTHKQDPLTMGYLKRQDLSFHYALADAFTLCDAYFCSVHADTCPNRIYLWSGTVDPRNAYGRKPNGPGLKERAHRNGYTWTTYPERLDEHGVSWKLYQGGSGIPGTPTDNYTDNSLEFFAHYQIAEGALPTDPHVLRGVSTYTLAELKRDVERGELSQVSWIVAPHKYCEHPEASPTDGAYYISLVLDALTSNPEVWSKTVLFINYDENDGLFDHVVPPMPPADPKPNGGGMVSADLVESLKDEFLDLDRFPHEKDPVVPGADPGGLQPIGLGPRVPMLIVSPWTTGGWVCSQVFDHTSVLQFLEQRFGVAEPNISAWRRAVCGDLTSAFDFQSADGAPKAMFVVPAPLKSRNKPYRVPRNQKMPVQEPGTRPARALPYVLRTECHVERDRVSLDLLNEGKAGAAFYIYNGTDANVAPRRYTVSAGDCLSDSWPVSDQSTGYDLTVYGPNGYLAHFRGNAISGVGPEVRLSYDTSRRVVGLAMNPTEAQVKRIHLHEAYSNASVATQPGPAGAHAEFPVASSEGWFDIAIENQGNPGYLRRFAGHLEDGSVSRSDPGPPSSVDDQSLA